MQTMAFAGANGALLREAHLRGNAGALAEMFARGLFMVLWQGKLAVEGGKPLWLAPSHPILRGAGTRVFLGTHLGRPLFAVDLPDWQTNGDAAQLGPFDAAVIAHPDLPIGAGFADLRSVLAQLSPLDGECAASAVALMLWHGAHGYCARCGAASTVAQGGWQRICGACGGHHFPRTDPVVIMLVQRGDRLLLGRSPGWPEGMYSLLAGFVEPGEVIEAAVRREVAEETGIVIGDVRYVASQPWPFPANLMVGCVAQAQSEQITLDPAELQDAMWLTRSQVLQVQLGQHPRVKPARKGAIAQYLIEEWLAGRIE